MKRTYSKPYLLVESFQLDAAIAASCSYNGLKPLNHDINSCQSGDASGEVYIQYVGAACDLDIVNNIGGDENDKFCYQGPIDPYAVFMDS